MVKNQNPCKSPLSRTKTLSLELVISCWYIRLLIVLLTMYDFLNLPIKKTMHVIEPT